MQLKLLKPLTLGYLLLPNLIFFWYWTAFPIAIAGIAVLIVVFAANLKSGDPDGSFSLTTKDLLLLTAVAFLLTFVSGTVGLAYQTFDYWCHNTKFYELFKYEWPIRIPATGPVISYYYGYYVVPALVSKWWGSINETVIFIWTMLGFFLGLAWVYIVLNKKIIYTLLATSVGDTPHVIKTVFYKFTHMWYQMGDFGIESWSNFENLLWVPNQVIPTLIVGGMFVYLIKNKLPIEHIVFPVALTFWWAVFPAFTSGLLAAILIVRKWIQCRFKLDWPFEIKTVVIPFLACLPVLVFFLSHEEAPISGFIWQFPDHLPSRMIEYLVNIGINLVLFFLFFQISRRWTSVTLDSFPFYLVLFFFMIFPIYRIGKVNDFLFRGLMPYLLIIGIYLFYPLAINTWTTFWAQVRKSFWRAACFILMISCSFIAIGRVVRSLTTNTITKSFLANEIAFEPIPYDAYANIYEVLKDRWSQREADQYLGKKDSFYELVMAPRRPMDK